MEKNSKQTITIVGLGLIGGSFYKAAIQKGYHAIALDKDDAVRLDDTDILLLALPQEILPAWYQRYAPLLKKGAIAVDTCGVKSAICETLRPFVPQRTYFVGGHPMAGREHSGLAYADAALFHGASMILTPYPETPAAVLESLTRFFSALGFGRILTTTPEHHDRMIAYTSQLSHVIAAAYTQEPLSHEANGYAAGSYANMTRIASMNPAVWEALFSANKENLLPILDHFIERLQDFRTKLNANETTAIQEFIQRGAASRDADGVARHAATSAQENHHVFGNHLKLAIYGASHAPAIGMRLENFPRGVAIDSSQLQSFLERRAPGRDSLSTSRREPDVPEFLSGLENGVTTGERIEAVIHNTDTRPQDYQQHDDAPPIPRPGHADFPQWVQTGRIPTGGGANSGRMTAPMCIAGGLCLQWLARRNIRVSAQLVAVGGKANGFEETILAAKKDGDSVGGVIELTVTGLPAGLGGAMFDGVESELSAALFAIPGVKGVEFGEGFHAATMRGSENNDAFAIQDGRVVTRTNHHGGLLGGMTTGAPLVVRLAMKPTPSIFKPQQSVNLASNEPTMLEIRGRHDPCIARRALPVAEALAAFVIADVILTAEAATPRICLTLTDRTLNDALQSLRDNRAFIDMAELRVDCLAPEERLRAADFPRLAEGLPVILTLRRVQDGGQCNDSEDARHALFQQILTQAEPPFAYVDFESDFHHHDLEELAHIRGTRIIRSLHDFTGPVHNLVERCQELRGSSDDIPKIAFAAPHCADITRLFQETADFTGFPHILCAMGPMGVLSRILAVRTHSMLTFTSPQKSLGHTSAIGHLSPETLVRTYGFRKLTAQTALYAVTGWPLGHTASPELNNAAFFAEARDAVLVPLPAETAEEAIRCAEALGIRGMAVTIPHKQSIIPFMASLDDTARAIGAVNTAVQTPVGWRGFNTDAPGFRNALLAFLQTDTLAGRRVAILGAGGAACAVAYAIHALGAQACIFNHTYEKAVALAERYGFQAAPLSPESVTQLADYADIIIQATSVGLNATSADDDPIPFYPFKGTESVYDLVYKPALTPILTRAQAAGCRVQSGMSMLIAQAEEQRRLYKTVP